MFDAFLDWVKAVLGDGYEYSSGMWIEHASLNAKFICSIRHSGGPAPSVDDRRQRFQVILLGPRNGREHTKSVSDAMESLAQAAIGDSTPCGAASVRAGGEPDGPRFTTENRVYYTLDFQVLF